MKNNKIKVKKGNIEEIQCIQDKIIALTRSILDERMFVQIITNEVIYIPLGRLFADLKYDSNFYTIRDDFVRCLCSRHSQSQEMFVQRIKSMLIDIIDSLKNLRSAVNSEVEYVRIVAEINRNTFKHVLNCIYPAFVSG